MANVSTSQKVCIRNYAVTYHISTIQKEFMDLEQLNPLSEETGNGSDMDLSGISVTVHDRLDQYKACILSVAKMFGKGLPA